MAKFSEEINLNGNRVKISYNPNKELAKITNSAPIRAILLARANEIAMRANGMYEANGYGAKIKTGKTRARGIVYTGNMHTMYSNRVHNTLKKALGGK